ncbi:MAG: MFS transporter [Myxococcales bacterium]|nr:MFS transporter [Myxococcales bacterium]
MNLSQTLQQTFRSLAHRNYRLFISGQLASMIGTWLQSVAQSWLVYRLTGSSLLLGALTFALQFPLILIAPFGGVFADRFPRRPLLMATAGALSTLTLVLGVLTISANISIELLFLFALFMGVTNGVDNPTRQAFVVEMVGKRDLPNAIALNSSIVNMARIVGPALAGLLVATVGEGWCFIINGLSFTVVLIMLTRIRLDESARAVAHRTGGGLRLALREMGRGLAFVTRSLPMRSLLLLVGLISLVGMPYVVLMPIFADQILGSGSGTLGLLLGANGVGALSSALWLAARGSARGLERWVARAALGFGVLLIGFSLSEWLWLSLFLLPGLGACAVMQMASTNTLLQTLTTDEMRGRVMAAYSMMFFGMSPLGALMAGAVADRIGTPRTVMLGGLLSLGGALAFRYFLPRIERAIALQREATSHSQTGLDTASSAEVQSPSDEPP